MSTTVVWCDPNVNNKENQAYFDKMAKLEYLSPIAFDNLEIFQKWLSHTNNIFIIISSRAFTETLFDLLHSDIRVICHIVFCGEKSLNDLKPYEMKVQNFFARSKFREVKEILEKYQLGIMLNITVIDQETEILKLQLYSSVTLDTLKYKILTKFKEIYDEEIMYYQIQLMKKDEGILMEGTSYLSEFGFKGDDKVYCLKLY